VHDARPVLVRRLTDDLRGGERVEAVRERVQLGGEVSHTSVRQSVRRCMRMGAS
jgi:hypothetical protein